MNKLLIYLGIGLLFFCLVDPLDKIFGLKLFTLLLPFESFSVTLIKSVFLSLSKSRAKGIVVKAI